MGLGSSLVHVPRVLGLLAVSLSHLRLGACRSLHEAASRVDHLLDRLVLVLIWRPAPPCGARARGGCRQSIVVDVLLCLLLPLLAQAHRGDRLILGRLLPGRVHALIPTHSIEALGSAGS